MAYLVKPNPHDHEILHHRFEGGRVAKMDIKGDGRAFPRERLLKGMDLAGCIMFSMRAPNELRASVPDRIIVKPTENGYIPDFGFANTFGAYIVAAPFVELVEQLEPNTHQFFAFSETIDIAGRRLQKKILPNERFRAFGCDHRIFVGRPVYSRQSQIRYSSSSS